MAPLWAKYPLLTPFEAPTLDLPDGGYYYVAESSNNEAAYEYGANYYYPYMQLIVWGYKADANTFATFQAKFASWNVTESSGTYTATKNVTAEKRAVVKFSYASTQQIIKYYVYLGLETIPTWPTASAASIIQKLAPGSETVLPECPGGEKYNGAREFFDQPCGDYADQSAVPFVVLKYYYLFVVSRFYKLFTRVFIQRFAFLLTALIEGV